MSERRFATPDIDVRVRPFLFDCSAWKFAFRSSATRLLLLSLFPLLVYGEIPAAPGQLVDTAGGRLHINCTGTGTPTVILEAGFPGSSLDWNLVQPMVAPFSRVCSYDRAGFA